MYPLSYHQLEVVDCRMMMLAIWNKILEIENISQSILFDLEDVNFPVNDCMEIKLNL